MRESPGLKPLFQAAAVILALALTTLVLLATESPPLAANASIARGAVGTWSVASDVLVAGCAVPSSPRASSSLSP